MASCKKKGKDSGVMVQCHLCQIWHHYGCIRERERDIVGIWTCYKCRKICSSIDLLKETVTSLDGTVHMLQENTLC